ncbi:hypothetical protein P8452_10082 [Trifolium repens]|nr:hypothetical protein P8452_10082 [Trifolium repens]
MECYFGDAILYKVEKDYSEEDEKISHFKVISMCNEVEVVNKFIDEYLSNDENIEPISSIKKNSIYCAGETISSLEIQSQAVVEQEDSEWILFDLACYDMDDLVLEEQGYFLQWCD